MRIINPEVTFLGAVPTSPVDAISFMELAGRICYKSEVDSTDWGKTVKFIRRLISNTHMAMIEHSNFVARTPNLYLSYSGLSLLREFAGKYLNVVKTADFIYIGGSLTAWYQSRLIREKITNIPDLFFNAYAEIFPDNYESSSRTDWSICPDSQIPHELQRYSMIFVCDRGVSHELVRHRPCSFAQESTRYVDYMGKEMEFIQPWWYEQSNNFPLKNLFYDSCTMAENFYNEMRRLEVSPQVARTVLTNAIKTTIIVTADPAEWRHIRKLRDASPAHPDMQRVMKMVPWDSIL